MDRLEPFPSPSLSGPASSPSSASSPAIRYVGERTPAGRVVWVDEGPLRHLLPYRGDDPMLGYGWGRPGTAPRELARSLIYHCTGGNEMLAARLCRDLAWDVLVILPADGFELDRAELVRWLDDRDGPSTSGWAA